MIRIRTNIRIFGYAHYNANIADELEIDIAQVALDNKWHLKKGLLCHTFYLNDKETKYDWASLNRLEGKDRKKAIKDIRKNEKSK